MDPKSYKTKLLLLLLSLAGLVLVAAKSANAQQTTCVNYFYGQGCPHCAQVEPLISELSDLNEVTLKKYEIYNNRENSLLLDSHFEKYSVPVPKRGIPIVFVGDKYLVGDKPILNNLKNVIDSNRGAACPSITADTKSDKQKDLRALSLITIIGAALVDSINPCAIAVLLILLGTLLAAGDKKKAFKAGLAFTLSIYIAYFLFGIGLFSALKISGLAYWFSKIIGVLAIIIGLANIKDYFWYGAGGFVMEIPRRWRPRLQRLLRGVTSPAGAFLMGFVVSLFELPCTGGPYIVILGLLAEKTTRIQAIPLLLLYNLFFIFPLLLINFLIFAGHITLKDTKAWKEKNIRNLHLIAGIIMVILGFILTANLI